MYLNYFTFYLTPRFILSIRLLRMLKTACRRRDFEYILDRVNYYNKLSTFTPLPSTAPRIGQHRLRGNRSAYFFDTFQFTRYFPRHLRWLYEFGDVTHIPTYPSIVKSRPIMGNNENSVILKLDKARHFCFLKDKKSFKDKRDIVIFRGDARSKPHRQRFIDMYQSHPMCDVYDICSAGGKNKRMTLYEHLDYKFIMALEGHDVASNLKWVMSTNSIAVMPRPTYETWFMEGRLIANHHYIEIKADYSDLIERITYYIEHPQAAQRIIDNANVYVSQFLDIERENLISSLVLDKYFRHGQNGRFA